MPERIFIMADQLRSVNGEKSETESQASDAKPPATPDYQSVWKDLKGNSVSQLEPMLIMRPIPNRLSTFDALEGFLIWLKAGLLVGATIASPGIFWHVWQFLAAGLYPHERKYVYIYLPLSVLLFVSGVCLAFFVIFELVIEFLLTYNEGMDIDFATAAEGLHLVCPLLAAGLWYCVPVAHRHDGVESLWRDSTRGLHQAMANRRFGHRVYLDDPHPGGCLQHDRHVHPAHHSVLLGHRPLQVHAPRPGLGSQAFDPQ